MNLRGSLIDCGRGMAAKKTLLVASSTILSRLLAMARTQDAFVTAPGELTKWHPTLTLARYGDPKTGKERDRVKG